jgi:hypothetical protein
MSKEAVVSRLEHYLMQLNRANTPKYQRYLVESEVVIRHSHVNGEKITRLYLVRCVGKYASPFRPVQEVQRNYC